MLEPLRNRWSQDSFHVGPKRQNNLSTIGIDTQHYFSSASALAFACPFSIASFTLPMASFNELIIVSGRNDPSLMQAIKRSKSHSTAKIVCGCFSSLV